MFNGEYQASLYVALITMPISSSIQSFHPSWNFTKENDPFLSHHCRINARHACMPCNEMSAPYLSFVIARLFTSFKSEFHLCVALFKFMIKVRDKTCTFYNYGLSSLLIFLYRKISNLDISVIFKSNSSLNLLEWNLEIILL